MLSTFRLMRLKSVMCYRSFKMKRYIHTGQHYYLAVLITIGIKWHLVRVGCYQTTQKPNYVDFFYYHISLGWTQLTSCHQTKPKWVPLAQWQRLREFKFFRMLLT